MKFPEGMLEFSTLDGASDLSGGLAFASKLIPYCRELTFDQVEEVPTELQLRVLLFDIWVSNEDRYLTEHSGNVNLLVDEVGELVVIDHNLAFDPLIGIGDFDLHVFSNQRQALWDLEVQARLSSVLDTALADWNSIIDLVPDEWIYWDPEDDFTEVRPTLADRYTWLQRLHEPTFWRDI